MSDRHKYAFNGGWFFENAREHMERDDFLEIPIGTIGGVGGWFLTIYRVTIFEQMYFYPFLCTIEKRTMQTFSKHFNIRKNDGSSEVSDDCFFVGPAYGPYGAIKTVDTWLNEENGYLINGGIMIEYGLQIEGILSPNDIYTFNFYDRVFDCHEKKNMITFHKNVRNDGMKFLHCHKQLLTFHSTYFDSNSEGNQMIELTDEDLTHFNHFLQLTHGVRDSAHLYAFHYALIFAQRYKLFNVIQLIDQFIVSNSWDQEQYFPQAISYDLNHYLANFLKNQKTLEELVGKLKKVEINKMSGEAMKKCVKRFFEF